MNGLFDSLRRLLAGLVAIAQTRLELVTTELAAEIQRAVGVLLWAAIALFFGGLSVLMIAITVVVATPDEHRLLAAGLVCATFVAGAIGAALVVRRKITERPPLLSASLGELRKDRDLLLQLLDGGCSRRRIGHLDLQVLAFTALQLFDRIQIGVRSVTEEGAEPLFLSRGTETTGACQL